MPTLNVSASDENVVALRAEADPGRAVSAILRK